VGRSEPATGGSRVTGRGNITGRNGEVLYQEGEGDVAYGKSSARVLLYIMKDA
jgi:hypothetical protein